MVPVNVKASLQACVTAAICTFLATFAFPVLAAAQQRCLVSAWDAYHKKDYSNAIKAADECIDDFGRHAIGEQSELEAKKEKEPPIGHVENASDKKKIFARWGVNDVSTAYFIKGRSAEFLSKNANGAKYKQVAWEAYTAAAKLTYGRCFDKEKDVFWSPAKVSRERLPLK